MLFIGGWVWVKAFGPSEEAMAEDFGAACYSEVRSQLKDPGSADLMDTGVQVVDGSSDDPSFRVEGTGRARNSFGGTGAFTWECSGFYSSSTDTAHANVTITQN